MFRGRLEEELARLERNKDRRLARDKQKLNLQEAVAGSPASPGAGSPSAVNVKATGTLRKCANCGQVGHIKTNKKWVHVSSRRWASLVTPGPPASN